MQLTYVCHPYMLPRTYCNGSTYEGTWVYTTSNAVYYLFKHWETPTGGYWALGGLLFLTYCMQAQRRLFGAHYLTNVFEQPVQDSSSLSRGRHSSEHRFVFAYGSTYVVGKDRVVCHPSIHRSIMKGGIIMRTCRHSITAMVIQ